MSSADGEVEAVFTGGSMLYGATGRTDLVSPQDTDELTHAQYHSVRRLARELPPQAGVYPMHGFGSFCSATRPAGMPPRSGEQSMVNPALTLAEQDYVDTLLAGLDAYPAYYAHMGPGNRRGAAPANLSMPAPVDPAELRRRIEVGEWVVDLRQRTAFAAGHLAGSLGFELPTNFVTYLGWLYRYGTALTLIGQDQEQILAARRELVRIGIDDLAGAAVGDIADLVDGQPLRSYLVTDFAGLARAMAQGPVQVLDARRNDERAKGGVRGSQHIPLHELSGRIQEVPDGQVWVYCGSGYRASITASMLDRPGRQVVLINDSYGSAVDAGVQHEQPTEGARPAAGSTGGCPPAGSPNPSPFTALLLAAGEHRGNLADGSPLNGTEHKEKKHDGCSSSSLRGPDRRGESAAVSSQSDRRGAGEPGGGVGVFR